METLFCEGDWLVKTLQTDAERVDAYRLRHDVFAVELKWVLPTSNRMESDYYDAFAVHFGIFNFSGQIDGYVRLIASPRPFMVEREFACLMTSVTGFVKTSNMVELTRICVRKNARTLTCRGMTLAQCLYKAVYNWCLEAGYTHMVAVVEKKYYILMKRSKFPLESVGDFIPLGAGVLSGVVMLDWRRIEKELKYERPDYYSWLVNLQDFPQARSLRRALY